MDADLSDAILSDCGTYRYHLTRTWDARIVPLRFIMLNPSTADAAVDDPTIRRCVGFAKRDGFGGIAVTNLYSFRATKPADLWRAADPVGPGGDDALRLTLSNARDQRVPVVAAWGANARPDRVQWLLGQAGAQQLVCLGLTKGGAPRHPLYVRGDAPFVPFGEQP